MPATHDKLTVCAAPRAVLTLFESQPPLTPDGVTIYRYSTRHKYVFEQHIAANGVVTWFRCEKVTVPSA